MALIESANAIRDLALRPEDCIMHYRILRWSMSHVTSMAMEYGEANQVNQIKHDLAALHFIADFNIPQLVPLHGEVSYGEESPRRSGSPSTACIAFSDMP